MLSVVPPVQNVYKQIYVYIEDIILNVMYTCTLCRLYYIVVYYCKMVKIYISNAKKFNIKAKEVQKQKKHIVKLFRF